MRIFVLTATYELRVSRKNYLRDHPSPNAGGGVSCGVSLSANEYSCEHHVTWNPWLWRSTSIFNFVSAVKKRGKKIVNKNEHQADFSTWLTYPRKVRRLTYYGYFSHQMANLS
jgi:hypothetical protein